MRKNKVYSAEEKFQYIQKYLNSDKTIERFIEDEGIVKSTFYKWLKIYRESGEFTNLTPLIKENIISAPIVQKQPKLIKLNLPNGINIETELEYLKEIIQVLHD